MHHTCQFLISMSLMGWAIACSLAAADSVPSPNGPPPSPMHVILRGEQLFMQQVMFMQQPETRTRTVEVDGKRQDQPYTVMTMVPQFMVNSLPEDAFMVFTVGGKRLSKEVAAAALGQEKEVLVSPAGKMLDPSYRPLYRPDAIIVYTNPKRMFGQDNYGAPPSPDTPAPQPPPTFANKDLPKGLGPRPGLLRKNGAQLVLTQFDWDIINEWKTAPANGQAPNGAPANRSKYVPMMHWVPRPFDKVLNSGEVKALNYEGQEMPGALDSVSTDPTPVFVQSADEEFDRGRLRLCRSNVMVLRGDFPQPDFASKYSAPAAPGECFASVQDGQLRIRRTVQEQHMVKEAIKGSQNGAESGRVVEKIVIHSKFISLHYPLSGVQAREATGKSLTTDTLTARLAVDTPVLVAATDAPIDASYVGCMKPDTIILALPDMTSDQAPATAAQQKDPASGPPPQFAKIQSLGDKLILSVPRMNPGYAPVPSAAAGTQPPRAKPQTFAHWDSRVIAAEDFRVFDANGQPIDGVRFANEAARPVIALFSDIGKKLDPAWFAIYDPRTIVVYVKPEVMQRGYHHGGGMIMAPPPSPGSTAPST